MNIDRIIFKDDYNGNVDKSEDTGNKKCRKKSSSINQTLSVAVVNSLWSILTGEKISHGDKRVNFSNCNKIQKIRSRADDIEKEG